MCLYKDLPRNVHSSIIHNGPKVEATRKLIDRWMSKQNMIYPHNRIEVIYIKKRSTDSCYNLDNPQNHSINRRRQTWKSISVAWLKNVQQRRIYSDRKQRIVHAHEVSSAGDQKNSKFSSHQTTLKICFHGVPRILTKHSVFFEMKYPITLILALHWLLEVSSI